LNQFPGCAYYIQMRRLFKKILVFCAIIFVMMNGVAAFHAYRFSHFSGARVLKTHNPDQLNFFTKIGVLLKGVDNPRPLNDSLPKLKYEEIKLKGHDGHLSCWLIPKKNAKGTVILFHGYASNKSTLIPPAAIFDSSGYQTVLVDFMGCGASEGNRTTVGYYEAEDVLAAYKYFSAKDSNIVLFGSSMGASAIMRAVSVYHIRPAKVILECPFGSMMYAVKNRFKLMGVPSFPMAYLLVFWGGVENGYPAFFMDCVSYAKDLKMPVLLMRGKEDKYVSEEETLSIYQNLPGPKTKFEFNRTGHESYCLKDHNEWVTEIEKFLE
jgi:uncharacterized protein